MATTEAPSSREILHGIAAKLDTKPKNQGLEEFGVEFTERPLRDIGCMAWLLALQKEDDRVDRYLVFEETSVSSPGCGTNPQRTATVDRLVVDMRHGVMRMARERHPDVLQSSFRSRSVIASQSLTAHADMALWAQNPMLLSFGGATTEQTQEVITNRLFQVSDGMPSPLDSTPAIVGADNYSRYPGMETMLVAARLLADHHRLGMPTSS